MSLKSFIAQAMEKTFGDDTKRINHAHSVLGHAEKFLEEEAADEEIVVAAALLHDIGIQEAERKYNSNAGKYQEIEGPTIAREILENVNFPAKKIEPVLDIIAHHHSGGISSPEFDILVRADRIVNKADGD